MIRVGFLVYPEFPLLGLASAVETLEAANKVLGLAHYQTLILGEKASSATGITIIPDNHQIPEDLSVLILVAPLNVPTSASLALTHLPDMLGGIAGGGLLLADAGYLNHYRAKLQGEPGTLTHLFPDVRLSSKSFELDRNRLTCAGGTAATDMILALISRDQGVDVASAVSELLVRERLGYDFEGDVQGRALKKKQPQIHEAILLMETNLEEPLGADDLASLVGISRRQLERLFRKHLNTVPSKYYLRLRLEKAQQLLRDDTTPVVQVALACGFSNASHFSTAYRNFFEKSPREDRQLKVIRGK